MNFYKLAAAVLMLLLFLPLSAAATLLTITFDSGFNDPTVTDPNGEFHGPYDWLEGGARVQGFWAQNAGTAAGEYVLGHTHPEENVYQDDIYAPNGYTSEFTHSWTGDLLGLAISLQNGATFDLISIDYDIQFLEVPEDTFVDRLAWSFAASNPQILAATSFDPSAADFEGQWTAFDAISTQHGSFGPGDWHTIDFTGAGFTNLTSVMISQTATWTWLDNIVIDVHSPPNPVPEPSTALLMGLGLAALSRRSSRDARA